MFLAGKAHNTIFELDDKDILHDNHITTIINKLNSQYKKDELNGKYEDLEHFESYKGSLEIQMQQFVAEFDQAYNKLTRDGITICSDHLGFKLFKTANLSHHHEQLIKATITGVSYDNIKNVKSIFSNETEKPKTRELQIKAEPTYCTKEATTDEEDYDNGNNYDISDTKCDIAIQKTNIEDHIPPNINISTKI